MSKLNDLENQLIDMPEKSKTDNDLLSFFLGLILVGAGLFLVFQNTTIGTDFHPWRIGNFTVPTGVVTIPFFIGIIMLFFSHKNIISWIITVLGLVFILLTVILSVRIRFTTTSLFVYILMFGLIMAGAGLLLKVLFRKK